MISYSVYKIVHLTGVFMVIMALGGIAATAIAGGGKTSSWRKPMAITHGAGMLISLIGGFGLLARLGIVHGMLPGWVFAKLGIWLVFGGMIGILFRKPDWAKAIWPTIIVLGGVATYLAGSKPF